MLTLALALALAGKALACLSALAIILGTVRNTLHQLGWISAATDSKLAKAADVMSLIAEKGKAGLAGPLSLPGFASTDKPRAPGAPVALLLAGLLGLSASGCLLHGEAKTDTTAQRLAADTALVKQVIVDVRVKCGPKFASFGATFAGLAAIAATPADYLSDVLEAIKLIPELSQDASAITCLLSTVAADLKAGQPASKAAQVASAGADLFAVGFVTFDGDFARVNAQLCEPTSDGSKRCFDR